MIQPLLDINRKKKEDFSMPSDRLVVADGLRVEGVNHKGYGIIPKALMLDRDLSLEAKAIYAYIASFAGAGETAFPGRDKILRDLDISKTRYYKHFDQLKDAGYISVVQENLGGNGHGFQNNVFTLVSVPKKYLSIPLPDRNVSVIRVSGLKACGYGFIPKSVMTDSSITIKAKGLYAYYCSFSGAGDSAMPKKASILYHLGISDDTYVKHNRLLIEKNYIEVVQRYADGRLGLNDYFIVDTPDPLKIQHPENKDAQRGQRPKNTDTQTLQHPDFEDTQVQDTENEDTQKQYTQNWDANINKSKINRKNNQQSDNQQKVPAPQSGMSDMTDDSLLESIISLGNIPEDILKDDDLLERTVHLLTSYDELSRRERYEHLEGGGFAYERFMLFNEALIQMLTPGNEESFGNLKLTSGKVQRRLPRFIETGQGRAGIASLINSASSQYAEGARFTQIRSPLQYMKRCIWEALVNGDIKTEDAIANEK